MQNNSWAGCGAVLRVAASSNKFIAKIASDWNKPNGQYVVRPQDVDPFVAALPVDKLFGVGKVTAKKMHRLGAHTCADLRSWTLPDLQRHFGSFGARLHALCRGIDERGVNPDRERKSVSVEETYATDLPDLAACARELAPLIAQLRERIQRKQVGESGRGVHKLFVKIRFDDFRRTTAECLSATVDAQACHRLLETAFARAARPVRLLGVGVRLHEEEALAQRGLFEEIAVESVTDLQKTGV